MEGDGMDETTGELYTVTELASNGELAEFVMKVGAFGTPDRLKYLKLIFS